MSGERPFKRCVGPDHAASPELRAQLPEDFPYARPIRCACKHRKDDHGLRGKHALACFQCGCQKYTEV